MVSARQAVSAILRAARTQFARGSRSSKLASSAGMLVALTASFSWTTQALAQETPAAPAAAPAATDSSAQPLQEVTVTGSRIKRTTDFTTPTPTTVIDTTTMQNMGVVNIGQALEMTPANISNFTPANTGNSNFFAGAYIPDLRGLNPFFGSRTLTLIDTRRAVQTNQGDSFDLNFIPQILVERIDTVTGGASAAYGSGAIAGVINVILDNKLEGGKINADMYQTEESDARDRHVSAAYGHSLFDGRVHFVVGGEFENQDGVGCENARTWCGQNSGLYTVGESPAGVAEYGWGTNLRNNIVSPYGAFLSPSGSVNTLQATPDGTGVMPYTSGTSTYPAIVNNTTVQGGQGDPLNQYTNLLSPVNRGLLTGMITAAVTDTINFNADLNWGKVRTINTPGIGSPDDQPTVVPAFGILGQNILGNTTNGVATAPNAYIAQLAAQGNPALLNAVNAGYTDLNKDWFGQIPSQADTTTVVKRVSAGFDGKFGDSSWTWDGYGEYGLTEREQLVLGNRHAAQYEMAMDSVLVNGTPECRVTAAGGIANVSNPSNPYYNPAATYTGPSSLATNSILAQGCVPIDPFGNQPLSQSAYNYSFGELDEKLRYTQTVAAFNSSGDLW
jgi:iron complex outermembrane recepter protein